MIISRRPLLLGLVVGLMLSACSGVDQPAGSPQNDTPTPAPTETEAEPPPPVDRTPHKGYPSSIAVLGHSGATGESSDPSLPLGTDAPENSWATGTNPDVNSVYLRILEENPAIGGNNFNLAEGGSTVDDLGIQAGEAVRLEPTPELFLIQSMDNDIVCPATQADYEDFGSRFVSALQVLSEGAPGSRIFVTSQFGRPSRYARIFTREEAQSMGGTDPCDLWDLDGRLLPKNIDRLEEIIRGYEEQAEAGCRQVALCEYDEGAFSRAVDIREYLAQDQAHLSIEGHAAAAEIAWSALQQAHLVPRSK